MEGKKRQRIIYSEAAKKYLIDNYGNLDMLTIKRGLKKITGKWLTDNAIRIKAYRLGLDSMQESRACYLVKDLNELLHTTQAGKYAKEGKFGKRARGINGTIIDVDKFWKWAETSDIDFTKYERGTILPEPKPGPDGKSWLDKRIEQQRKEKEHELIWDEQNIARLKLMIHEGKLTRSQIAKKLNITESQLNYRIQKLRLQTRIHIKITEQEKQEVYELYKNGTTITDLCTMYSRCRKSIKSSIKQMQNRGVEADEAKEKQTTS